MTKLWTHFSFTTIFVVEASTLFVLSRKLKVSSNINPKGKYKQHQGSSLHLFSLLNCPSTLCQDFAWCALGGIRKSACENLQSRLTPGVQSRTHGCHGLVWSSSSLSVHEATEEELKKEKSRASVVVDLLEDPVHEGKLRKTVGFGWVGSSAHWLRSRFTWLGAS